MRSFSFVKQILRDMASINELRDGDRSEFDVNGRCHT